MHIKRHLPTILYRSLIGLLSLLASWSLFVMFGASAWRLFVTWALLMTTIYYLGNALFLVLLGKHHPAGWTPAPTWQLASLIALGLVAAEGMMGKGVLEIHGQIDFLIRIVLPVLVFVDWLILSQKGQLRLIDPWYALTLPACYAAWILLSADYPRLTWRYPYPIFELAITNIPTFLWWLVLMLVIILVVGYAIYALDFAASGKLSQYIVMPKLKRIEITEETEDDTSDASADDAAKQRSSESQAETAPAQPAASAKPVEKPAKKTMDVCQAKPAPTKTSKASTANPKKSAKSTPKEVKSIKPEQSSSSTSEPVPIVGKVKNLTPEKQAKLQKKVSEPATPAKPEEPETPKVPQIENRKKDQKSAQNLHGKK